MPISRIALAVFGGSLLWVETGSPLRDNSANAFCNDWSIFGIDLHCDGDGHTAITHVLDFLNPFIYADIADELSQQDKGEAAHDARRHFDSCRFREGSLYIRDQYRRTIEALNPDSPRLFDATNEFGKLLHPVQDFYAHSNWVEMLLEDGISIIPGNPAETLVDHWTGEYLLLGPMGIVRDDVLVGEFPAGVPSGWIVQQNLNDVYPTIATPDGTVYRGLVSGLYPGWEPDSVCPDVRDGTFEMARVCGVTSVTERTSRLVHGDLSACSEAYCPYDMPTNLCLNKDEDGRPHFDEAFLLAKVQTGHEFCRLLHLTRDTYGLDATSMILALWMNPDEPEEFGFHFIGTPCQRREGPIGLRVSVTSIEMLHVPGGPKNFVFSLYTSDFTNSARSPARLVSFDNGIVDPADLPHPLFMSVEQKDTLVATVWGWSDGFSNGSPFGTFDPLDSLFRGVTAAFDAHSVVPGTHTVESSDIRVQFCVERVPNANDIVWVDSDYFGPHSGAACQPFSTIATGVSAVPSGGRVLVREGRYAERLRITKPLSLEAIGGVVTIIGQ